MKLGFKEKREITKQIKEIRIELKDNRLKFNEKRKLSQVHKELLTKLGLKGKKPNPKPSKDVFPDSYVATATDRQKANNQAISILDDIDNGTVTHDSLTEEQLKQLALYSGSGGGLLSKGGLKGSPYEYYTPKPLATATWDALEALGFKGGKVLDPSAGTGIFATTAPKGALIDAVELDEVSGKINQILNAEKGAVTISAYEAIASNTPDDAYDAVVTNIPFGDNSKRGANKSLDTKYRKKSLEAYFILRTIDKVKPSGLCAFISSSSFLDGAKYKKIRSEVALKAEFIGAIRLPNAQDTGEKTKAGNDKEISTFQGADVTSDMLFFRKHTKELKDTIDGLTRSDPDVLKESNVLWDEYIKGKYFRNPKHKKYIMGDETTGMGQYGEVNRIVSTKSIGEISKVIRKARFEDSRIDLTALQLSSIMTPPPEYKEGDYQYIDGQMFVMKSGAWERTESKESNDSAINQILADANTPLDALVNKITGEQISNLSRELNNKSRYSDVPEWITAVLSGGTQESLESYETALTGMATRIVFDKFSSQLPYNFLSAFPELSDSIKKHHKHLKSLTPKTTTTIKQAVKFMATMIEGDAFVDVWLGTNDTEALDDIVLGENNKFDQLKYRVGDDNGFVDINELEAIGIDVWNDDDYCISADGTKVQKYTDYYTGSYADFLAKHATTDSTVPPHVKAKLDKQFAQAQERLIKVDTAKLHFDFRTPFVTPREKVAFLNQYTPDLGSSKFFIEVVDGKEEIGVKWSSKMPNNFQKDNDADKKEWAKIQKIQKRYYQYVTKGTYTTGNGKKDREKNPKLEQEYVERLRSLVNNQKSQFDSYCRAHQGIQDKLKARFNNPENQFFERIFDGSDIDLPNLSDDMKLHDYQNMAVRSFGENPTGILGDAVGLGKTAEALAVTEYLQSRRIKKKTLIVIPNKTMTNWKKEAGMWYKDTKHCLFVGMRTNGDKTTIKSADYAKDMTKILSNKHSTVFMTMTAFEMIPLQRDTYEAYESYISGMDEAYSDDGSATGREKAKSRLDDLLTKGKNMQYPFFEAMGFDSIMVDEGHCFPAGTLVDGVPIETIKIGDYVNSYNHSSQKIEKKLVTDIMRRKVTQNELVEIKFTNGSNFVCTTDHPIYVADHGYTHAGNINVNDNVLYFENVNNDNLPPVQKDLYQDKSTKVKSKAQAESILLNKMLPRLTKDKSRYSEGMSYLWDTIHFKSRSKLEAQERNDGQVLLFSELLFKANTALKKMAGLYSFREAQTAVPYSFTETQSFTDTRSNREKPIKADSKWSASREKNKKPWWKGQRINEIAEVTFNRFRGWLGIGVRGINKVGKGESKSLHDRYCKRGFNDSGRSGWAFPLFLQGKGNRSKENTISGIARVESVTFLERGSRERFESVCSDGYVYDITVEDNHNFFAENILVHNCLKNSKMLAKQPRVKGLGFAPASIRGKDAQVKAWYIRGKSPKRDGVMLLTATPITNSPLEIYSMLSLAVGEENLHKRLGGVAGGDDFISTFTQFTSTTAPNIIGEEVPTELFAGLNNAELLRGVLNGTTVMRKAEDVGNTMTIPDRQDDIEMVELSPEQTDSLKEQKSIYQIANKLEKNESVTNHEKSLINDYTAKTGETTELLAHPFNIINKMTKTILDNDLAENMTVYYVDASQQKAVDSVLAEFNALELTELRPKGRPTQLQTETKGTKESKDSQGNQVFFDIAVVKGYQEKQGDKIKIKLDTVDFESQNEYLDLIETAGLECDVDISPKIAKLIDNVSKENMNPKSPQDNPVMAKQLIFCDLLGSQNKLKIACKKAGIPANKIIIANGKTLKDPANTQELQDGFNAEGGENLYEIIIANKVAEVGINLQKGTQAIHHITLGWTPDSLQQRDGRGLRQGNYVDNVSVYQYFADGTFDQYKKNLVDGKNDWIQSLVSKNGGDVINIASGMSREEQDLLVRSVGDADAFKEAKKQAEKLKIVQERKAVEQTAVANLNTIAINEATLSKHKDSPKAFIFDTMRSVANLVASYEQLERSLETAENKKIEHDSGETVLKGKVLQNMEKALKELPNKIEKGKDYADKTIKEFFDNIDVYETDYSSDVRTLITSFERLIRDARNSNGILSPDKIKGYSKEVEFKDNAPLKDDYTILVQTAESIIADANKTLKSLSENSHIEQSRLDTVQSGNAKVFQDQILASGDFITHDGKYFVVGGNYDKLPSLYFMEKDEDGIMSIYSAISKAKNIVNSGVIVNRESPDYQLIVKKVALLEDEYVKGLSEDELAEGNYQSSYGGLKHKLYSAYAKDVLPHLKNDFSHKRTVSTYDLPNYKLKTPDNFAFYLESDFCSFVAKNSGYKFDASLRYIDYSHVESDTEYNQEEKSALAIEYASANNYRFTKKDRYKIFGEIFVADIIPLMKPEKVEIPADLKTGLELIEYAKKRYPLLEFESEYEAVSVLTDEEKIAYETKAEGVKDPYEWIGVKYDKSTKWKDLLKEYPREHGDSEKGDNVCLWCKQKLASTKMGYDVSNTWAWFLSRRMYNKFIAEYPDFVVEMNPEIIEK